LNRGHQSGRPTADKRNRAPFQGAVSQCPGPTCSFVPAHGARAIKYYKSGGVAVSSQGESSASEGYCFEAYSGGAREKLPVIFVIQNNKYGISVPVEQQSSSTNVADNFRGIKNLRVIDCDGTDIFDSMRAMREAVEHAKSGKGAVMVHAQCIRMGAHSNSDAHDLYRTPEELAEAQLLDPVLRLRQHLVSAKILDDAKITAIEAEIDADLDVQSEKAEAAPKPSAESIFDFVNPPEINIAASKLSSTLPEGESTEKLREAITRTLIEEFRHNKDTFIWGQDVASKEKGKGGVLRISLFVQLLNVCAYVYGREALCACG
jgi:2-oxoisovalerate dehydrogenase E1 component